jgi:DNA (cytosine-5)-methyltransferase 1
MAEKKKNGRRKMNGAQPTSHSKRNHGFIDLFCGAGGFTWGWVRAGFIPLAAIDNDVTALRTHEANFGNTHCITLHQDLNSMDGHELTELPGVSSRKVSVIVGGPPCQGWSKVGRGKLRSLGKAGEDLLADPRNTLYRRFIEMVAHCRPIVCVMENVPGMLSVHNTNVADVVKKNFEAIGYACTYALVNAGWFGVPQDRNRLIFLATRRGTRKMEASKLESFAAIFRRDYLGIARLTTVADAIRDLPEIENGTEQDPIAYVRPPGRLPRYAEIMREQSNGLVTDHVCRTQNDQDVEAFGTMTEGMKYHQLDQRFKRYRDDIFRDKYKKLIWDAPSWTVTAHLGKDCYTHIHPGQARTISIREAARLQSFPDDFRFWGNMGDRFRQIGNAVPPLMAWGIAEFVKKHLSGGKQS